MTAVVAPSPVSLPFGDAGLWTTAMDTAELKRHVDYCRAPAATTKEKGARLEQLMCWLIPHIPGIQARLRDVYSADHAQEVDVVFYNHELPEGFPGFGPQIFGECKNWSRAVDSPDVAWFDWKMRLGGVSYGFLIAAKGITTNADRRDYATSILTAALADSRRIMVLTLDEIEALQSTDDLRDLIIDKTLKLSVRKPFG